MTAAVAKMEDSGSAQRRMAFQKSYSIEHGESWRRRSLIEDAKFESASNAEYIKPEDEEQPIYNDHDPENSLSASEDEELPCNGHISDEDLRERESRESISEEEEKPPIADALSPDTGVNTRKKITVTLNLKDNLVSLNKILKIFENYHVQVIHIESRPNDSGAQEIVSLQCEGFRYKFQPLTTALKANSNITALTVNFGDEDDEIIWFPTHISQLDECHHLMTKFEPELDIDHPGFTDKEYRERRKMIADLAFNYKTGLPIPTVEYTQKEIETWGAVYRTIKDLHRKHACREYLEMFDLIEREVGLNDTFIPQLEDISRVLQRQSGFTLRPVAGLLTARDFLASLAFRVFQCTQYVRHPTRPHYSPEPDCIHDILGHCPMFCNPTFAHFSQELGLASLGASDQDIEKFSTLYWFTVEFGLLKQSGELRVYGAGTLSSYGELLHALSGKPEHRPFDPIKAAAQEYRDEDYQPIYFVVESFEDMKEKMRAYTSLIKRPYEVRYDPFTQSVTILDHKRVIEDTLMDLKREILFVERALTRVSQKDKN